MLKKKKLKFRWYDYKFINCRFQVFGENEELSIEEEHFELEQSLVCRLLAVGGD